MKINKKAIPEEFLSKKREDFSSIFGFTENLTLVSYFNGKKCVLLLSSLHKQPQIDEKNKKKPQIIRFYNERKYGVDIIDKMIGQYTTRRATRRWFYLFL